MQNPLISKKKKSLVAFSILVLLDIVGNKAKGQISKRMFQEKKTRQIFKKTNNSYPLIRTRFFFHEGEPRQSENYINATNNIQKV